MADFGDIPDFDPPPLDPLHMDHSPLDPHPHPVTPDHHASDHGPLELPPDKKDALNAAFAHAMGHDIENAERNAERAGGAARKGILKRFGELHGGVKAAIIGGTVALGAIIGYWAFKSRHDKAEQQGAGKSA